MLQIDHDQLQGALDRATIDAVAWNYVDGYYSPIVAPTEFDIDGGRWLRITSIEFFLRSRALLKSRYNDDFTVLEDRIEYLSALKGAYQLSDVDAAELELALEPYSLFLYILSTTL